MKKLFCVLALLLVLPRAGAVSARAAVVIDADTGETLFEQNADSRLPMASTTKIMTALVALGEGDLDRVYRKAGVRRRGRLIHVPESG